MFPSLFTSIGNVDLLILFTFKWADVRKFELLCMKTLNRNARHDTGSDLFPWRPSYITHGYHVEAAPPPSSPGAMSG